MTTTNYGKVRLRPLLPTCPLSCGQSALGAVEDAGGGAVWAGPWASAHLHGFLLWQAWAAGDIVSCLIDLDEGTLSFSL